MLRHAVAVLLALPFALGTAFAAASLQPDTLRCELLDDPVGIDITTPRLSWVCRTTDPARRGQSQTAYQVLVASSMEKLQSEQGDLWDTGRVPCRQSINVLYAGAPLTSHQRCFWMVRVWDEQEEPSGWSRAASFSMGILDPAQWGARWITYTPPADDESRSRRAAGLSFDGCEWVWHPEGDARQDVPAGSRYFRHSLTIPAGKTVLWAQMLLTVDDRFILYVNGRELRRTEGVEPWRTARVVDIAPALQPGGNTIAVEGINNALSPAGMIGAVVVQFADGETLRIPTDESWKSAETVSEGWTGAVYDDSAWKAVVKLGAIGSAPWHGIHLESDDGWSQDRPSPVLRKSFSLDKPVASATVYLSGLGFSELHLNGQRIGDRVLDPVFTRYDRRVPYVTYDVAEQLRQGDNAVGVLLGNGWFNQFSRDAWDFQSSPWRARPRLLLHLRIVHTDGSVTTVASDDTWQGSTGPIVRDGVRNGEIYDARLEMPGWDTSAFDASAWKPAEVTQAPAGRLRAQMMPPVRVHQTLTPISVAEPQAGVFLFDIGQSVAGWAKLLVSGPAGTEVTLRYGERLRPDGTLEQAQIASLVYEGPFQTDRYILKGQGLETFEPHFTYHGFRYVEVTGFPGKPTVDSLRAQVAHTSFTPAGSFECSNGLLNQIQKLTLWSYRGNYLGFPTDCPHREKNGWTGDAHLAAEQGLLNWDNAPAYEKWMNDFSDEQRDNGELPGIVPTSGWGYGIGPAWDSAYILIPWYLYVYRGDESVLATHYQSMKRYVDYLTTRQKDYIVDYGLSDWVPAKTATSATVTSTGYYYIDALTVSRVAAILGLREDAEKYATLAERIAEAFNRTHYKGEGIYAEGSQCALSCALYQGLAPVGERDRVLRALVANVESQDGHLDTGILGAKYLFRSLTDGGRVDVAYRIATQTTFPSYGDWLQKGATTLWEDWAGGASQNHIMFGDISAWFYEALAGITPDPEHPGFRHFVISPHPVADLTWVKAEHECPYGTIRSAWRLEGGKLTLQVTVPPNTTATIRVPAKDPVSVTEGGEPVAARPGVNQVTTDGDRAVFEVGSGQYEFVSEW